MERIAIYGIGKMGLPLAIAFANKGFKVTGVDVNPDLVRKINAGKPCLAEEPGVDELLAKAVAAGNLKATLDGVAAALDSEIIVILVPTLVNEKGKPDLSIVREVAKTAGKGLHQGAIVVTECTMPPGETEALVPILEKESGLKLGKGFGLAHCPERTSSGTALRDITGQYPKVIGASDAATAKRLKVVYDKIDAKGCILVSSIKAAECVKVFEGVYRDVNIALANELARVCERLGVDAAEVFTTANTQPYSHIHKPGCGVGGHCIPYYPYFIMSPDTPLIRTARETNDEMPRLTAQRVLSAGAKSVLVLGLTFRGGVKEFRKSPALEIIPELKKAGCRVFGRDPLCSDAEVRDFGAEPMLGFKAVDAVIVAANHKEFKAIDWRAAFKEARGRLVFDGVGVLDRKEVEKAGGTYLAWGASPA